MRALSAPRSNAPRITPWLPRIGALVVIALIVGGAAAGLVLYSARSFNIAAASMAPTLIQGDRVLVEPLNGQEKASLVRGDVVVFRLPGVGDEVFVKRVVGVPGDEIRYEGQHVWLNGQALRRVPVADSEPATPFRPRWLDVPHFLESIGQQRYEIMIAHIDEGPKGQITVPADRYFMLGDNRNFSNDSRFIGLIPFDAVIGKPTWLWWSAVTQGMSETRWARIGRRVQ